MSENDPNPQVIEIHPDCRYVLTIPEPLSMEELVRLRDMLQTWWESGVKFVILNHNVKLLRLDR